MELKVYECQDCGKIVLPQNNYNQKNDLPNACFCCVDMSGIYEGKNEKNEFKAITVTYNSIFKKEKTIFQKMIGKGNE